MNFVTNYYVCLTARRNGRSRTNYETRSDTEFFWKDFVKEISETLLVIAASFTIVGQNTREDFGLKPEYFLQSFVIGFDAARFVLAIATSAAVY